jgi:hypothetical protein
VKVFIFGISLGIITETLILLSPIFDITLWEYYSNFVKLIPVAILQYTAIIGFILLVIAVFLELAGKRKN